MQEPIPNEVGSLLINKMRIKYYKTRIDMDFDTWHTTMYNVVMDVYINTLIFVQIDRVKFKQEQK